MIKPATPTAWLAQRMVKDVVDAGILPDGALNIVCGSARDLLDYVAAEDVVSFTGSAQTAALIRNHPQVVTNNVRVNIEADSLNSAILGPELTPDHDEFKLAVREIVKEMTIKSGQKCTAIRRIFVPRSLRDDLVRQLRGKLQSIVVGDPRNESVRMGPLVSPAQKQAAESGLAALMQEAKVVFGGGGEFEPLDGAGSGAFFQPTLLLCEEPATASRVHEVEVFGPVATILPYRDIEELLQMLARGKGSLVASLYSADQDFIATMIPQMADWHGRIMVVDAAVGAQHTGHGNVMPNCLHGGPGRAGGGEELGGLRALAFYHRRYVVQGGPDLLTRLSRQGVDYCMLSE
jgi:3,4-dehydroadipyl-CoA semialdehyde dehydrogenase